LGSGAKEMKQCVTILERMAIGTIGEIHNTIVLDDKQPKQ